MDRRNFLKSFLGGFAAAALTSLDVDKTVERYLAETNHLSDSEFVTYFIFSMNMFVTNPAKCMVIKNISEIDA